MTNNEIIELLQSRLSEKRFNHSIAVAEMSKTLASIYGADKDKAYLAGLVHDCMREADADEFDMFVSENNIQLSELESGSQNLWHAVLGAKFAETVIGINDNEVLNAIRYHTTGRADMSLLERVVYIADCTSADRQYNGVEAMRELAQTDLDKAVLSALNFCVEDLKRRNIVIHPDTLSAYNHFLNK